MLTPFTSPTFECPPGAHQRSAPAGRARARPGAGLFLGGFLGGVALAWSSGGAAQDPGVAEPLVAGTAPPAASSSVEVEEFEGISDTELQVLFSFGPFRLNDRASAGQPVLTFQHFSTFRWGSNFFFLDVSGQDADPDWHFWDENSGLYLEYAPSFSLSRLGILSLPEGAILRDISPTPQLNLGWTPGGFPVNRVWFGGLIFSWNIPGFVTFDTQFLARAEYSYDISWQVTLVWFAPFSVGGVDFEARGFLDLWQSRADADEPGTEDKLVLLTQPQLVVKIGPIFVGFELEVRHDFPRVDLYADESSTWDMRISPMLLFDF